MDRNRPDNPFSFVENGWHSAGAYQRKLTLVRRNTINARYLKIVIYKQPDSYAAAITEIGEDVHKKIVADEIEINQ